MTFGAAGGRGVVADPSTEAPALQIRALTAGYGRVTVLRDVALTVPPRSIVALLGPNGAGKTTLIRAAAGLIRPQSGSVSLCGREVTKDAPYKRARAGLCMIPEGRGIFRALSVRENLVAQCPERLKGDHLNRVLEEFPILQERLGQVAGTLSGGEQQMLALARCYLTRPRVVLLDEVSMGLAPRIIDRVYETIRNLALSGTALLLVEQYVDRALDLAEHVYMLELGRIVFDGPPASLNSAAIIQRYLGFDPSGDSTVNTDRKANGGSTWTNGDNGSNEC